MISPNILVTNICNQNCTFCFAKKEMGSKKSPKELSFKNYKNLLKKLKKGGDMNTVKLLGGEPLLHSKIKEIVHYTFKHSKTLQIFTNGVFDKDKLILLKPYARSLALVVNVSTPGFKKNPSLRKLVLNNIRLLGKEGYVVLALTVGRNNDGLENFRLIPKKLFSHISGVRIGIINPLKNNYPFEELPTLGNNIFKLVKKIKLSLPSAQILFNCGLVRCMFTPLQLKYFKQIKVIIPGWGCFGKDSQIDITTDNKAINCYVTSDKERYSVKYHSIVTIEKKLLLARYKRWFKKKPPSQCLSCKYYQFNDGECPGPCLA